MNKIFNKINTDYNRNNIINFILHFFIFQTIFFVLLGGFIKTHFSVDTYTVLYGMDKLPVMYGMMGRFLTGLLFQIFNIFNINVVTHQVIFMIIGICIYAITAQVFYYALRSLLLNKNDFFCILSSVALSLSIFIGGLALFPELFFPFQVALLCIAVGFLLVVKDRTRLGIGIAIVSLFFYQVWFPIFIGLFFVHAVLIKKISFVKAILYSSAIYVIGFAFNYGMIKVYSSIMGVSLNERVDVGIYAIIKQLQYIPIKIHDVFITSFQHVPKYYLVSIISILLIFIIFSLFRYEQKFKKSLYVSVIIVAILMTVFLPLIPFLIGDGVWMPDRYVLASGTIVGLIYFLFLLLKSNKYIEWFSTSIIIIVIVAAGIIFYKESNLIIVANKFDENLIQKYTNIIEQYENETGITILNIQFARDADMKYCKISECRGTLTISSFATAWSDIDAFNYYNNKQNQRNFLEISSLNENYCIHRNWDEYNDEQIIINGQSALICIY